MADALEIIGSISRNIYHYGAELGILGDGMGTWDRRTGTFVLSFSGPLGVTRRATARTKGGGIRQW